MKVAREEIVKSLRQFVHQFDGRDVDGAFVEDILEAAADMLEKDGKLINASRQVDWVSVDEKLPCNGLSCRVVLDGDFRCDYPATYRAYDPGPGFGRFNWDDFEYHFYSKVTHWKAQPLYNVKEEEK